ncbi:MAG: NAD(P)-dependent oxidoreductase [Bryobacteraceae bacterium]
MKVVVLGATGGTGLGIVRQAIERGHSVTALVRSPERLNTFRDHINIKQGNLLNNSELEEALNGQDAVLSAFGPRVPIAKTDKTLLQEFARALIAAMSRTGLKRVIVESTAFLFKDSIFPPTYLFGKLLFPSVVADASAMEELFQRSQLDWTLVRPPKLTDGRHSGKYRVREGHLPRFGFSISRADVADCFLSLLDGEKATRKIIGVSH